MSDEEGKTQESIIDWESQNIAATQEDQNEDDHAIELAPAEVDDVDDIDSFYASRNLGPGSQTTITEAWEDNTLNIWATVVQTAVDGSKASSETGDSSSGGSDQDEDDDKEESEPHDPDLIFYESIASESPAPQQAAVDGSNASSETGDSSSSRADEDQDDDEGVDRNGDEQEEGEAHDPNLIFCKAFMTSPESGLAGFLAHNDTLAIHVALLLGVIPLDIYLTALKDLDIGSAKLYRHLPGIIRAFGKDLDSEVEDSEQVRRAYEMAAKRMMTNAEADEILELLAQSQSFRAFLRRLDDFNRKPYERRIAAALKDSFHGEQGERAYEPEQLEAMAEILSTVPVELFDFSDKQHAAPPTSLLERVREKMSKIWPWWPLGSPPVRLCRLRWQGPDGALWYLDVPHKSRKALQAAFETSPDL